MLQGAQQGEFKPALWTAWHFHRVRLRLTRHKISDRARERVWLRAGGCSYTRLTHRSGGAVRCIAWLGLCGFIGGRGATI
jgi:hypothetical protein